MSWNDERIKLMGRLWELGTSASKIAHELGGFSGSKDKGRNAVIGKARREGFVWGAATGTPKKPARTRKVTNKERSIVSRVERVKRDRRPWSTSVSKPPLPLPEQFVEQYMIPAKAPENVFEAVIALRGISGSGQCRYPIGDPSQPGFHFCNLDGVPGRPYCSEHLKEAVQPYRAR